MPVSSMILALGLSTLIAAQPEPVEPPPNVIIIFADDLGWGDLGCYGQQHWSTPRIDRMAAEGARLTQFYVPVPYCAPSRAALLTGRYPFRSGMTRNPTPDRGLNDFGIPQSEITLGELFRQAGYRTACIGKWHLGHRREFYPIRHGFDEYLGILYSNDMHPVELIDGDRMVEYPVVQATLTKRYTQRALQFIEKNQHWPFLLYLPHAMPHKPLAASDGFYRKSGAGLYGDTIEELDWSVGEILDKLKALGIDHRTLVIFTSDNGPWYGGSTGGLRGMKGRNWEGGIRVPCIARWPGRVPAGHVSDQAAIVMDLYVTAASAVGIELPSDRVLDGRDIMPLLTSEAGTPHEALYSFRGNDLATVRSGPWKLCVRAPGPVREKRWKPGDAWVDWRAPDGVRMLAPYEQAHPSEFPGIIDGDEIEKIGLFNLDDDMSEQHNLADEHPDIVKQLRQVADRLASEMKGAEANRRR